MFDKRSKYLQGYISLSTEREVFAYLAKVICLCMYVIRYFFVERYSNILKDVWRFSWKQRENCVVAVIGSILLSPSLSISLSLSLH